ncbi:MAG: RHS repeat-associated core domain-containing protein, partial [Verrucomicrobia bacterium]|nr:RHS repeat-associated core domain-containing protein [Verrucomicrobiota bacterium]
DLRPEIPHARSLGQSQTRRHAFRRLIYSRSFVSFRATHPRQSGCRLRWTNQFGYDSAKHLTSVTAPGGTFTYTLGAANAASPLPKKVLLGNTSYITNTYTYDSMARLTGTYLKTSANVLTNKHEYSYTAGNQRTQQTFMDAATYGYTYDNIGQLTNADSSVAAQDRKYVYDAAWNLNYRTNNTTTYSFKVDGKNQLTNATPVGAQTYDDNGNVTFSAGIADGFSYDDENQLQNWYHYDGGYNGDGSPTDSKDKRTEFIYDGKGRLRKRVEYTTDGSVWIVSSETRYLYDGMRVIQERNSSNTPTVAYTRGTDLSGSLEGAGGIGGLLGRSHAYQSGSGSWTNHNVYHADGNGNVTYMLNSSQSVVANYRYDPFGNAITASGTLSGANVYRFSSKEIHVNSGLYYYGYRFYHPNLQRWLNRDPIGERGGLNLFEFAGNDPVDLFDRFGLFVTPTDFPPGGGHNTVICFNGKLTIQNKNKGPDRKCTGEHEYSHLQDWLKRYGDGVCKGQNNGTVPVGGDGYLEFLRQSECKAFKAGKKCREDLLTHCKKKDKAAIQAGIDRDNQGLKDNKCN